MAIKKIIKSISISKESEGLINTHLSNYGELSNWVDEQILNNFISDSEMLEKKKQELTEELEEVNKKLLTTSKIDGEEMQFLATAKQRLDRDWSYLPGILNQYYNLFGRRVSEEYFKKRMKDSLNHKNK